MTQTADRLYELLPAVYRLRDLEQDGPLKNLFSVMAEELTLLEHDLQQSYDDLFIETCAEWVIPYIGDLIGYRPLHRVAPKITSPRAEVANTIAYRRRKGTATMLEQLANDVTGWPARVVEAFQLLGTTQYMNHLRPERLVTPDLRQWEPLERLHTPFDRIAHTVDVRRIRTRQGLYNIPNIAIFLWRIMAHSLTDCPAFPLDSNRYFFSPLGLNTPLYTNDQREDVISHLAEPINVPMPISRRVLHEFLNAYYGKEEKKSIYISVDGDDVQQTHALMVCNLSDSGGGTWAHVPPDGFCAIDPELGRIAFSPNDNPPNDLHVTFHYGFSTNMAGGEYDRSSTFVTVGGQVNTVQVPSAGHNTIQQALDELTNGGIIEITDSGRYEESLTMPNNATGSVEIRAGNTHRPTLILGNDFDVRRTGDYDITLNGLLIAGSSIQVPQGGTGPRQLRIKHCTFVPELTLIHVEHPLNPSQPSLVIHQSNVVVDIDRCIVGGLRVAADSTARITNSFVDATEEFEVAFAAPDGGESLVGGFLHIENSTLIGKVHTQHLQWASNSIFLSRLGDNDTWSAPVFSERTQMGCVRFSYFPLDSHVPPRYRCQPREAEQALRVRPQFTSLNYGDPGYGQLTQTAPLEIRTGADDEAEMGVFHNLYAPQRESNLEVRLDEYLRFGLEAGIFYSS